MNGGLGTEVDTPDQRQRSAPPQEWELRCDRARRVAAHEVAPMRMRGGNAAPHIGIMIARHQGHVEPASPAHRARRAPAGIRRAARDDEIAGDRDVVGLLCLEVGDDARAAPRPGGSPPLAPPVDVAGDALADQLDQPRLAASGAKMRIRHMRQQESDIRVYALPIRFREEHQKVPPSTIWNAADQERRVHVAIPDIGNGDEFQCNHDDGDRGGGPEIRNQVGQGVADAADGGHHPANRAAQPRCAAAGERAVIGGGFGKAHRDAGADRRRHADQERFPGIVGRERGGEHETPWRGSRRLTGIAQDPASAVLLRHLRESAELEKLPWKSLLPYGHF